MKPQFKTVMTGFWIDDKNFQLTEDLIYDSKVLNMTVVVPKGFITDFASVPRVPIAYTLFGGKAHHEAVIHDYLYRTKPHICSRPQADRVFLEAMKTRQKGLFLRVSMYLGVRIGGSSSWK